MSSIYCTYLTIYSGSKLPPFYMGSSSLKRIQAGYKGSVKSKLYKNICPHCNKTVDHLNAKRWHLNNCKFYVTD